jgi:hypothetical protein
LAVAKEDDVREERWKICEMKRRRVRRRGARRGG